MNRTWTSCPARRDERLRMRSTDAKIGKGDAAFTEQWTDVRLVRIGEEGEEIVLADIDIDPVESA